MVFGQRLLAPREARRRRSKEGSRVRRLSPKKEEEKKRSQAIEKKTFNHRSLDSTSNQPSLALTLCLEGEKKEKKQKGRRVVKRRWLRVVKGGRSRKGMKGVRRDFKDRIPPLCHRSISRAARNAEEFRGEKRRGEGRGKTGASRRAWIRVPVCTLTPSLSLSGRNARWSR